MGNLLLYLLLPAASLEGAALLAHYAPDSHALEVRSDVQYEGRKGFQLNA